MTVVAAKQLLSAEAASRRSRTSARSRSSGITSKVRQGTMVAEVVSNFIREMQAVANNDVSLIRLAIGLDVGVVRHDARRDDRCN